MEKAVHISNDEEDNRKVFRLVECHPWDTSHDLNKAVEFYIETAEEEK